VTSIGAKIVAIQNIPILVIDGEGERYTISPLNYCTLRFIARNVLVGVYLGTEFGILFTLTKDLIVQIRPLFVTRREE
jgi:hypothetical protein